MNLMKNTGETLKSIFNVKSRNEQFEKIVNDIPAPQIDTKVLDPFNIGKRTIYPVIKTYVTMTHQFIAIEYFPVALLVQEQDNEYVISITDEEINSDEFLKMIPKKAPEKMDF